MAVAIDQPDDMHVNEILFRPTRQVSCGQADAASTCWPTDYDVSHIDDDQRTAAIRQNRVRNACKCEVHLAGVYNDRFLCPTCQSSRPSTTSNPSL